MPISLNKIFLVVVFSFISNISFSQLYRSSYEIGDFEGRFGISLGTTNYITKTDALFSKSAPGYSVGVVGTAIFSEKFELLFEINYTAHFVKFVGREQTTSEPEDIKFELDKFNVPILINYTFLNLDDEWRFGAELGPSFSLLHNYKLLDSSKEDYYLDPLYLAPSDLEFDTQNGTISFNVFLAAGLTADYKQFRCNFRYYYGLTDPYRQAPFYSPAMEIKGKDSYFALSLVYLFGEE